MKKLYSILVVLPCIIFVLPSCSKQSAKEMISPVSPNVINATIAPNQSYALNVSSSGNVVIEKQASHYKISKTVIDEKTGQVSYQYVPALDYTGTDEVVLSKKLNVISSGNTGGCNNNHAEVAANTSYSTSYTTIRITIVAK